MLELEITYYNPFSERINMGSAKCCLLFLLLKMEIKKTSQSIQWVPKVALFNVYFHLIKSRISDVLLLTGQQLPF